MIAFNNILVPVDFSEPSDRALEVAIDLAKQYEASLTVLHVFDVPLAYAGMGMSPIDLRTPMVEAARKQLDATSLKQGARSRARPRSWRRAHHGVRYWTRSQTVMPISS
jgi:nucleotide-binding universal stress UspA family protein